LLLTRPLSFSASVIFRPCSNLLFNSSKSIEAQVNGFFVIFGIGDDEASRAYGLVENPVHAFHDLGDVNLGVEDANSLDHHGEQLDQRRELAGRRIGQHGLEQLDHGGREREEPALRLDAPHDGVSGIVEELEPVEALRVEDILRLHVPLRQEGRDLVRGFPQGL